MRSIATPFFEDRQKGWVCDVEKEHLPMERNANQDPFVARLRLVEHGPWELQASKHAAEKDIIQPLPRNVSVASDASAFLDFLIPNFHRRLLKCFVRQNANRVWPIETLMQQTRPPSLAALSDALDYCEKNQFALSTSSRRDVWMGGSSLRHIANFGWTFEWFVQAWLERTYHALVRRQVLLVSLAPIGDIDVLAFLEDNRVLMIECKSTSKGITAGHVARFVQRAKKFPADIALLLIDTDDAQQMMQRLGQFRAVMLQEYGAYMLRRTFPSGKSTIIHMRGNLYVADTGDGLDTTIHAVLSHHASLSPQEKSF